MELDTETLNEVYQEVSDGCSEEPEDVNATSRKAKNTKDDHWTVKEQSGTNRKDWKLFFFFLIEKDWRWFHQKDVIYNSEQPGGRAALT